MVYTAIDIMARGMVVVEAVSVAALVEAVAVSVAAVRREVGR